MRITIGLAALATAILLAGCNSGGANNSAGNAPAPAAMPRPPATAPPRRP